MLCHYGVVVKQNTEAIVIFHANCIIYEEHFVIYLNADFGITVIHD